MNSKQREQKVRVESSIATIGRKGRVHPPEDAEAWTDLQAAIAALGLERDDTLFIGELDVRGRVCPTRYLAAIENDIHPILVVPEDQAQEAIHFFPERLVIGVSTLAQAVAHAEAPRVTVRRAWQAEKEELPPLGPSKERIINEVLALLRLGKHPYLEGPPGAGKTSIARRVRQRLDPISYEAAVKVSRICSKAGILSGGLVKERPFRAPHHSCSDKALRQECKLATHGVLFLDEAPEFKQSGLDVVAFDQPLTALILAGNPCPCGGSRGRQCSCSPEVLKRHQGRVQAILEKFGAVKIKVDY